MAVEGDPAAVTRAALIRPAAVTHSVDMAQRMITLDVTPEADGLTMRTPLDASVAPPGYYMLFVMNAAGVPSVASWVRIDPGAPDAPALPVAHAAPPSAGTPVPAPDPTHPVATPLRLTRLTVGLSGRGPRLTLSVRLRANAAGRARVTVLRGSRALTARTVRLRAGVLARPAITLRRTTLRGSRRVTVRIVVTPASGRGTTARRVVTVPRPATA